MAEAVRVMRAADPVARSAELLARALRAVDRRRERARLAIPGGSAAAALAPAREALGPVWSRVCLTWVDERCVAFADSGSNRGLAHRSGGLDRSRPPAFELPLFLDGESAQDALARVEREIEKSFDGALDVLLLGLGEDGHVASLFADWKTLPAGRSAHRVRSPEPPFERITLSPSLLASARRAIVLATGAAKRPALERVARGDADLPASRLRGLTLVTDQVLAGARR